MLLRFVTIFSLGLGLLLPAHPRPAGATDRDAASAARADSLHRRALERIAEDTIDSRRLALADLDEAARLAPARADLRVALGDLCVRTGQLRRGLDAFEKAVQLAPDDADAQIGLALAWKTEWLASTDSASLGQAVRASVRAANLAPKRLEPRLALTALGLINGNVSLGWAAARSAIACDPASADARLALGCAAYRSGKLALADSAFRAAIPNLAPTERGHLTELAGLAGATEWAPESSPDSPAANAAFWRQQDPDLTTPENEAELNVLARFGEALLLFRDRGGTRWDMRAELFARYGMPGVITLHPPDAQMAYQFTRYVPNEYAPAPLEYPYAMQVWVYPDLGMSVSLLDRSLTQHYQLPPVTDTDPDPRPDPGMIARNPALATLGDGRIVYRALPPGSHPMPARAVISRFPAETGARLLAHLEAPGGPADSLWGSWVVVSPDGREVARGSGALSLSACAPGEQQIADFGAHVPPGDYRVDLAVSGRGGRRGVVHLGTHVAPPSGQPAMSDLVLLCGAPPPAAGSEVRIEPNFELRIGEVRTISVYFEIDHLTTSPAGEARFGYTYRVRPVKEGRRRPDPVVEVSREEVNTGPTRRQFVNAQLPALKRGSYELEVEVRDLNSGGVAQRSVGFVKD